MRVAIAAQGFKGGTGRYAKELIKRLNGAYAPVLGVEAGGGLTSYALSFPIMSARALALKERVDLIHLTSSYVPMALPAGAKAVMTWHDLFPLEYGGIADRGLFLLSMRNYEKASGMIFNSEETREELRAYAEAREVWDASKLERVIPLGVAEAFLKVDPFSSERSDLAFVGLVHNRHKDLTGLMRVFSRIRKERDCALHVFTSRADSRLVLSESEKFGVRRSVVIHADLSDGLLAHALSRVAALLHVVKAEGFGLPILESLAVGTPVLVPSSARIPKVTSAYAMVADENGLVDRAIELLDKRRHAGSAAVSYARGFTWDKTVEMTVAFYQNFESPRP
ncbi:glycosyltransferase [Tardisphaera miroshnichenkoae]